MEEAGRRLLATGDLPDTAGTPTTVVITLSLADAHRGGGWATTGNGSRLSVGDALRLAGAETHHAVTSWLDGGATDLDNLALACGYHNNQAPKQGWTTQMINGIPHWTPPPWHPDPTPRRNYHHHPELLR